MVYIKKVLFLIHDLSYGGAERVLVNLVNNLDKDKYDITLQTLFDVGVNKQYLKPHVKYKSFFKYMFPGNTTLFKFFPPSLLYKIIVKDRYDIVISYLEGPTNRIISACPYKDSKKVCWIHIELNDERLFSTGYRNKKKALMGYKKFDRIICVSQTVKDVFENSAGCKFNDIEVLYNTNETDLIKKKSLEKIDDVIFDDNTVNVCSVAKLMQTKGYDRLVNAHKRLIDEGLYHHIYIIGCGELLGELTKQAKSLGVEDTFHFLGFKDNPYKYIKACDLYVCSSRREGFSTAVTEALVVGTPVVSTNCSGAYELLGKNNEYGIVVENSEQGIYEGLKEMLTDEKYKEYAPKALIRGKLFSRENTTKAVENMFERLFNDE